MLLPALVRAKAKAKGIQCIGNSPGSGNTVTLHDNSIDTSNAMACVGQSSLGTFTSDATTQSPENRAGNPGMALTILGQ